MIKETLKPFGEYKVTKKKIKEWFDILNEEVFDNVVPYPDKINLKQINELGLVWMEDDKLITTMRRKYSNLGLFLNILAHEMVHMWQFKVNKDTGAHNKHFYSWRTKFKKHGLTLTRTYYER